MKFLVALFVLLCGSCVFADARDEEVKAELARNRTEINFVQQKMQENYTQGNFPLSLAMAKWASQKSRDAQVSTADKRKYALIARDILNEAKGFGWQNRAPTSKESACMQSTSIDIALATDDKVDNLWDGSRSGVRYTTRSIKAGRTVLEGSYHDLLKDAAITGRYIASKASQLTPLGIMQFARMPGVNVRLVEAVEMEEPSNVPGFLTPNVDLVKIVESGDSDIWKTDGLPHTWVLTPDAGELLHTADDIIRKYRVDWHNDLNYKSIRLVDVYESYGLIKNISPEDRARVSSENPGFDIEASKVMPVFLLLLLQNFENIPPEFSRIMNVGSELVVFGHDASPITAWQSNVLANPEFSEDSVMVTKCSDDFAHDLVTRGYGSQNVHNLDAMRKKNVRHILELGRKYLRYTNRSKEQLTEAIQQRLDSLGSEFTVEYRSHNAQETNLTKDVIMQNINWVLNGYPAESGCGFAGALGSHVSDDNITEAEWLEMLSMFFEGSILVDGARFMTGHYNERHHEEILFYSQFYENLYAGGLVPTSRYGAGGCVPGRKNRILNGLVRILDRWITLGLRLN